MVFEPGSRKCGEYDIERQGEEIALRIDCENCNFFPSIEDDPHVMGMAIDIIAKEGRVTKIVFVQKRDFEYDESQTSLLVEIAMLYRDLSKEKLGYGRFIDPTCKRYIDAKFTELQQLIYRTFKEDPLGCYVSLKRILRRDTLIIQEKGLPPAGISCLERFKDLVERVSDRLEQTQLLKLARRDIAGFKVGSREAYRKIFFPIVKPDFMFTKLMSSYPTGGEEMDSYMVGNSDVTIFTIPDSVQYLYHIVPPEFKLTEEKYELLDSARNILAEYKPKRSEFVDPQRVRQVFRNVGLDMLDDLSDYRQMNLRRKEKEELVEILLRYTVGFGLIEVLLMDEKVQDISINSPMGAIPMFIVHGDYSDCKTNIYPTVPEAESWASKLRLISGRPLDEANPILDTELVLPHARARVAAIATPLNPSGLAYSFRRHRDKPWTFPLFLKYRYLSPLASGLLSFLIDGSRTMLVAGTRSAGKSSLLGSVMVELMRRARIITIEDTLELPAHALMKLGYNIQQLKVASAMTRGTTEVPADEGIRTTLRLGDSALFVGEVRSTEAQALYEAMRVGALANVVAGTIHGDSPYGVYDRVVNDLKVPKTSFKATDILVVANPIRSPDGIHRWRRVTQITEVRKMWENDPLQEGGFVDLMKYDSQTDSLQPTSDLLNGDSDILKSIAGNVKEWAGDWDAVWDNILLRSKIKETLKNTAVKLGDMELLEAEFVITANDAFHNISEEVREELGALDSKQILFRWNDWLGRAIKKRKM